MRTVWIRPRDDRQFAVGLLLVLRKPGEAALICRRASSRSVPGAARRSPLPCARASRSGPWRDVRRCCSTRLDSSPSVRCGHDQPAAVLAGRPAHHRSRAFGSAPAADGRQDQGVQAHQLARAADPVHDPLCVPPADRAACAGLPPTAGSSTCVEAHRTSGVFLPRASGAATVERLVPPRLVAPCAQSVLADPYWLVGRVRPLGGLTAQRAALGNS
jgi:hypothetical protein